MKRYVINQATIKTGAGEREKVAALFAEHGFVGKGNFCGWYGAEFYTNARMIAICRGERRADNIQVCNEVYREIEIWSCMVEEPIMAENDEKAVEKFKELMREGKLYRF